MKFFFRKLFNLYPGEEKNAFLFASLGFLWSLATSSGLKLADASFLLHVGASSLPIVYICTALCMVVIASFLVRAFHTLSIDRIFLTALFCGVCFYVFAYFCLSSDIGTESKWLWFALRIFGSIFFAVILTCYWTFIDQYHHLQDAKRLYSLFSSMTFLGIATTGIILRSGYFEFKHLALLVAFLMVVTALWIQRITRQTAPVSDEHEYESVSTKGHHSFRSLIRSIFSSRFALLLMSGNFLTYLLLILTEYNYMSSFNAHFDRLGASAAGGEEGAALTLFLGQWIAIVSIFNLIFGLFVYSRLVRRFGSNSLLMVTPLILLFTFSGWPLIDSLLFPLLGFIVVEGTLYVIDDSNFNLLLNAAPSKIKYKIRVIIESFFEPIGMLVSAIILSIPGVDSKIVGLTLSAGWLIIAFCLKKNYFKAIFSNLSENAIHFQRSLHSWFVHMPLKEKQSNEFRLFAIFKHGDDKAKIFAMEGLLGMGDPALLPRIFEEADKLNLETKIPFIRLLMQSQFASHPFALDHLRVWSMSASSLKGHVHFFLAKQGCLSAEEAVYDLQSPDLLLKGAAIISLSKANQTVAVEALQGLLESTSEEEVCMGVTILGAIPSSDVNALLPFLRHPCQKISRTAAASLSHIAAPQNQLHLQAIIAELARSKDNEFRLSCLRALGRVGCVAYVRDIIEASLHFRPNERRAVETLIYKMGKQTVPTLLVLAKDTALHDCCRVLAGRILGMLSLTELRSHLAEILQSDIDRAYFYIYHYHTIQGANPQVDLKTLQDCLLASFHSVLDFIIQLLGVAGEIEDAELLSRSIRSPHPKVRSQVVETLEKTCEPSIYRLIFPLVSDLPYEEKIQAYRKLGPESLDLSDLLDKLSQSSTQHDRIFATALKHYLDVPNWRDSLIKQMPFKEKLFHQFAYELLES